MGWHIRLVKISPVPHHCSSQELKTVDTHAQVSYRWKKKKERLTKFITYALIFYESWVVKGVPTVQDLRVLADHSDATQG